MPTISIPPAPARRSVRRGELLLPSSRLRKDDPRPGITTAVAACGAAAPWVHVVSVVVVRGVVLVDTSWVVVQVDAPSRVAGFLVRYYILVPQRPNGR